MNKINRIEVGRRMSSAVVCGGTVYLRGQTADDPVPCISSQTRQILDRIDQLLASAESDKSNILSATIWLSDIRFFDEVNKAWEAWVPAGCSPVCTTIEARLCDPKYLVEIMIQAAR